MASSSSFERPVFTSASTPRSLKIASAAGESLSAIRTRGMTLLRGFSLEERGRAGKRRFELRIGTGAVERNDVDDHVGQDGCRQRADFRGKLRPIAFGFDHDERMRRFVAVAEPDFQK